MTGIDIENTAPFFCTLERRVYDFPKLCQMMGRQVLLKRRFNNFNSRQCCGVLTWGIPDKKSEAFTDRFKLPLVRLDDGFLRSVGPANRELPLSVIIDDIGIYYDSSRPSTLESLIRIPRNGTQHDRAQAIIKSWRSARVSKFNHAREYANDLPQRYVVVVDQSLDDVTLKMGQAAEMAFSTMVKAALDENPLCVIVVASFPDVLNGTTHGHLNRLELEKNARICMLTEPVHPALLIEHAEAIYTVTSSLGFEGLLWGKRVRTFAMPFYAGWGLTEDDTQPPLRRHPVSLENLAFATLVDYSRYLDPETGEICQVERLLDWMGLQRRMRERFPVCIYAVGFSRYKKPIVRDFFQGSDVRFLDNAKDLPDQATVAYWSRKHESVTETNPTHPVIRLEDGFIRSVGLGADLIRPLSWVMDRRGIYFDATVPSDLEQLLKTATFSEPLLHRARTLRERLVVQALTKYNVGSGHWRKPDCVMGDRKTRLILVPGQVETDASIAYGALDIKRNIELLRQVRENYPHDYILYKPHPDVVAGLRYSGKEEDSASSWCDEIVVDIGMGELLPCIDEVHTLTSLTGFEALLRGKKVVCYGQPFYAGWGLTEDRFPVARRDRRLTLDELVAGVLILYPTYVSRTTGRYTTPERALDELLMWREGQQGKLIPIWRKLLRRYLQWTKPS